MCDPITAISLGATAASSAIQAKGAMTAASEAATQHAALAEAYDQQARQKEVQAQLANERSDTKFARFAGNQEAQIGATGINRASFSEVFADDAAEHSLEKQVTTYNAKWDAYQLRRTGSLHQSAVSGALNKGSMTAAGALISGVSGVAGTLSKNVDFANTFGGGSASLGSWATSYSME